MNVIIKKNYKLLVGYFFEAFWLPTGVTSMEVGNILTVAKYSYIFFLAMNIIS